LGILSGNILDTQKQSGSISENILDTQIQGGSLSGTINAEGVAGGVRRKACLVEENVFQILFPITPTLDWNESLNTSSQDLFGYGEIGTGETAKLTTVTLEGIFPHLENGYDFLIEHNPPSFYMNKIEEWMFDFKVLLLKYKTDSEVMRTMYCKITDFIHKEKPNKDMTFTLKLRQHVDLGVSNTEYTAENASKSAISSYGSSVYYVGDGDTLISIAIKLYGDSTMWSYLMEKNSLDNPLAISVGQELKI
jgi:LysM repeat protein